MSADEIRSRIGKLIDAIPNMSVAEVERQANLGRTYLQEFMSGKKDSMRGDSLARVAEVLGTSEMWLARGIGSEKREPVLRIPTPLATFADKLSSVSELRDMRIMIDSLSLATGECGFKTDSGDIGRGLIVDPALLRPGNVYTTAFSSWQWIGCQTKECTLNDGQKILFIFNALD